MSNIRTCCNEFRDQNKRFQVLFLADILCIIDTNICPNPDGDTKLSNAAVVRLLKPDATNPTAYYELSYQEAYDACLALNNENEPTYGWMDSGWIKEGPEGDPFKTRYWVCPGHVVTAVVRYTLGPCWYVTHNGQRVTPINDDVPTGVDAKNEATAYVLAKLPTFKGIEV